MKTTLDIIASYVAALIAGDITTMQAAWSEDYVLDWVHGDAFEDQPQDSKVAAAFWPSWLAAFPERDYEVTRTIVAENVVVTQWIFTGTHSAPLGPPVFDPLLPASGRTICLRGVSIYDLQDGRIQHETTYMDLATVMVELGVEM